MQNRKEIGNQQNETENWSFEINKIDNPLARMTKKKDKLLK